MSTLRNRVQLIGHLGVDPEVKTFDSGSRQVSMTIATNERYQQNGEWKEETQWHRLVAWNRVAERVEQQLRKGSFVLIEGKLTHRSFDNPQGEKRYITEVQVQNFVPLEKRPTDLNSEGSQEESDDLPF